MNTLFLIAHLLASPCSFAEALYICPNPRVLVRDFRFESDPRLPKLIKLSKNERAKETAAKWLRVEYQQVLDNDKVEKELAAQIATDPDIRFDIKNSSTGEAQLFSQSFIFTAEPRKGCYELLEFKLKITDPDRDTVALEHAVSIFDLSLDRKGLQLSDSSANLLNRQLKPSRTGGRRVYVAFSGRRNLMDKWELRLSARDAMTLMHWPVGTRDAIVSKCRKLLSFGSH